MEYVTIEFKSSDSKLLGTLLAASRTFKTGSKGFYASGKVMIDSKMYQCSTNIVEIGSKPKETQNV